MSDGRSYSVFTIGMVVFKGLVWAGLAFGALLLVIFVFNLAPYALAPFYTNWPQRWPGGIEGKMSDAELKRRVSALRALTASPQAAANSASSLTIVGVQFDHLRDAAAKTAKPDAKTNTQTDATTIPVAQPYPVNLDLSQSNRAAVVVLAEPSIAWSIVPPEADRPQALLGLESRLFPVLKDAPPGVLAGFRVGIAGDGRTAQPLLPDEAASGDLSQFCRSIADWGRLFSVPLNKIRYVLVQDPKSLVFSGSQWTSDGRVLLDLDSQSLRAGCVKYDGGSWKYEWSAYQ